jgi:hypothetical protein
MIKIYKIRKFANVFSTKKDVISKENSSWGGKLKIWMFKDLIEIFQGLIEFIECLIVRKINSWSYFKF